MKEEVEEACDNKSESTKSSKLIAANNTCNNVNIVEQKDDPSTTASQLLDTVIEMLKHSTITSESERNGILSSIPKDNYLFSDKLKQSCNGAPAEIANSEQEKCITSDGKEAENAPSIAMHTNASETMSFTSTVKQTGTSAASTLGFGDHNVQVFLTSSVPKMVSPSPIVTSSKSEISTVAQSLKCHASIQNVSQNQTQSTTGTPIQLAKGGAATTSVYSPVVSPILNTPAVSSKVNTTKPSFTSTQPNVIDVEGKTTPTIESKATTIMSHTSENKGNVFNKSALMSIFDGSRNLFGTTTVQTPMSTDTKPQASFPFRNKYAASFELLSKRSLCSQKELQEKARIADPKFEMTIPTFCKAFRNVTFVYVFGSQETITPMFVQMSESVNIFKTPPVTKTNTLNKSENLKLQFNIGAFPSVYSGKSPAQQNMTRPTNKLQNYKINLYKYKDYKRALAMFEEAIKLCPDNYTFYFIRAQYYMKLGMYTEAVKDVQKVIDYDSSFIDGYICLAKCCIALGDVSATEAAVNKAREVGGNAEGERASKALRELRARYTDTQRAITAGDYARAVASADGFLELCPSNYAKATKAKCLAMLGRTEQALKIAEECLRNNDAEPEALYAKGLCLYYSCKLHQAVDYFQQVISGFPLHLGAIDSLYKANRLQCLAKESKKAYNQGDYRKVIALNNEAMTVDKMNKEYNVKLYCNNAVMYSKLNETHLAVKSCSDALRLNEKSVVVLKNRAKCYTRLGQYEDAVRDCEKVYQIDKNVENEELLNEAKALVQGKENAYRKMASSVESLVRDKKFQEALKLADECLQIRSSDTDVLYSKGLCFYYMDQYQEALDQYKQILLLEPSHSTAFKESQKIVRLINIMKKGDSAFMNQQWQDALDYFNEALTIDEYNRNLKLRLYFKNAEIYEILTDKHSAIKEYTKALEVDSNCSNALSGRAQCYSDVKQYEQAVEDYEKLYTIYKDEEVSEKLLIRNSIERLKEKEKLKQADTLIESQTTESLNLALKIAEEFLKYDTIFIRMDEPIHKKALCVKGLCLYYKDQYEQALDQFRQVLLFDPSHPKALKETKKIAKLKRTIDKGDSAFINQRWQDALDYFNEALKIDEYNRNLKLRLYFKNAEIYEKLNDKHSAIKEYTKALKVDSNCSNALSGRAQCYSDVKQYEQAVKDYEKLYTIYKDEEVSEKLLIRNSIERLKEKIVYREKLKQADPLLASQTTESLEIAQKIAEECLKYDNTDTEALCVTGLCLYYKDQYQEALDQFKQILLLEPSHSTALQESQTIARLISLMEKGDSAFTNQRWQEALDYFNEALTIDEYNRNLKLRLYSKMAKTYVILNDKQSAIKEYTKALEVNSNCSEALWGRAQCYSDVKKYEQAVEDFEKLHTIYKDEQVWEKLLICNSIERLKEKTAYREKLKQADPLLASPTTESLEIALKIAEECLKYDSTDTEALFVKGSCLYYKCQFEESIKLFEKIININATNQRDAFLQLQKTNSIKYYIKQGDDLVTSGRWSEARYKYKQAKNIDTANSNLSVRMHCKMAETYLKVKKKYNAIKEYTCALRFDTRCLEVLRKRAKCYTQLEWYEDAMIDYTEIYNIAECEEMKTWALNFIKTLQEKESYRKKIMLAKSLMTADAFKNADDALKLAEECLQFDSSYIQALCVKGSCLYYKDQYQEALDQYKQILLLEPSHSTALQESQKIARLISLMEKGDSAFINQRWQDALDYFSEALTIDEYNRNLKLRLYFKNAEIYEILNDKQSAIKEYTKALEVDSNCSNALSGRAQCYSDVKQYEQAIEDYDKLYTIYKDEEVAEKLLICNSIERLKEKIAYREKLKQADTLLASRTTESLEIALKIAEECLKYDSTDPKALFVKGSCLYYKDQYQEALDQYKQILLLEPSHSTALKESQKIGRLIIIMEKGDSAFINQRWQDALDYFSEALTIDEYNRNLKLRLYFKNAEIYEILNDKQSAIKEYTKALEVDSNCSNALSGRAQCYSDVKQYEQAIEDYEKLYTIYKDEEVSEKLLICNSIERLKEKIAYREKLKQADTFLASRTTESLEIALKIAEECLKYDSTDPKALFVKGSCLYYKGEYEQALDQFREVLLLEPSHPMALKESKKIAKLKTTIDKGNDSFTRGRLQDALDNFNEALTIDGENKKLNVRLHCKKATTLKLISERNIHAAIKEYTMALALDENFVEALRGRAQCYSQVKQYEDAVKDYEMLYTLDQSEEIKQLLDKAKMAHKEQKYRFAQERAEIGHKHFKRKKFRDALAMYKEAIKLDPETAEYYSNTYSCYIHLSMLKEAFIDAKKAVALDAKSSKGFSGIAKCYLALGELSGAQRAITKASDAGYDFTDERRALATLQRLHSRAQKYIEEQNYDRAIACMDQCLQLSPFSSRVKLLKAECLAMLGKIEQALQIADDCIRLNQSDEDALFIKGLCLYYNEKHDQAMKYFKEALHLSPDHRKATAAYKKTKLLQQKKEQGNEEFKMGRWQKALLLYNEALAVDQTHKKINAKLHFNKATVYRKLNQTQLAADSCSAALELDQNYVKALTLRATCFTELEEYDCVIDDYEKLYRIDPSDDIKRLLDEAKRCQDKKSLRRNYYEILGLDRSATKSDIIRAYRQLSLMHHPDRHSGRSEFERKRQERQFKLVLEAYTVLNDPVQRREYDARGHTA